MINYLVYLYFFVDLINIFVIIIEIEETNVEICQNPNDILINYIWIIYKMKTMRKTRNSRTRKLQYNRKTNTKSRKSKVRKYRKNNTKSRVRKYRGGVNPKEMERMAVLFANKRNPQEALHDDMTTTRISNDHAKVVERTLTGNPYNRELRALLSSVTPEYETDYQAFYRVKAKQYSRYNMYEDILASYNNKFDDKKMKAETLITELIEQLKPIVSSNSNPELEILEILEVVILKINLYLESPEGDNRFEYYIHIQHYEKSFILNNIYLILFYIIIISIDERNDEYRDKINIPIFKELGLGKIHYLDIIDAYNYAYFLGVPLNIQLHQLLFMNKKTYVSRDIPLSGFTSFMKREENAPNNMETMTKLRTQNVTQIQTDETEIAKLQNKAEPYEANYTHPNPELVEKIYQDIKNLNANIKELKTNNSVIENRISVIERNTKFAKIIEETHSITVFSGIFDAVEVLKKYMRPIP